MVSWKIRYFAFLPKKPAKMANYQTALLGRILIVPKDIFNIFAESATKKGRTNHRCPLNSPLLNVQYAVS